MNKSIDIYPSRNGSNTQIIHRQDPVVYASKLEDPPLDIATIENYEQNGFIVLEDMFNVNEVKKFNDELGRLLVDPAIAESGETINEPDSNAIRSIFRIHVNSAIFNTLSKDKRLVSLAEYLLSDDVYIHQSRLNYKPGFRGKEFYWHSDFETWHVEDGMPRMRALSMSITLTDNLEENGSLMLIPKSHKLFATSEMLTPNNHYETSLKKQDYGIPTDQQLTQLVTQGGIKLVKCKPGSVIVFDCNTMHGSSSNITPFPRSNIFFVYNAMTNKVQQPFSNQTPRPEYICTREDIKKIEAI